MRTTNSVIFAAIAVQSSIMGYFWFLRSSYATHASWTRWIGSLAVSTVMVAYASKRKSLNSTGAAWAFPVGFALAFSSVRFMVALLAFFLTSSRLTKWKAKRKASVSDEHSNDASGRNYVQVLCNGGVALACSIVHVYVGGAGDRPLTPPALGVLVSLACACGDTWASEIGSTIASTKPRLITTWERVPPGTNGGITLAGTVASAAGGFVTGAAYWLPGRLLGVGDGLFRFVLVGVVAGVFGSAVDSLLGSTLQYSGFDERTKRVVREPGIGVRHISGRDVLSNDAVNVLSCVVTTILLIILF